MLTVSRTPSGHHRPTQHTVSEHLSSPALTWFIYSVFSVLGGVDVCFCSVSQTKKCTTKPKTSARKSWDTNETFQGRLLNCTFFVLLHFRCQMSWDVWSKRWWISLTSSLCSCLMTVFGKKNTDYNVVPRVHTFRKRKKKKPSEPNPVMTLAWFFRALQSLTLNSSFKGNGSVEQTNTTVPYVARGIIKWVFHRLVIASGTPKFGGKKKLTWGFFFSLMWNI